MPRHSVSLLIVIVLSFVASGEGEVEDFEITPQQAQYKDIAFQVLVKEDKLQHNQWKVLQIVVSISTGKRKVVAEDAYFEVWKPRQLQLMRSFRSTLLLCAATGLWRLCSTPAGDKSLGLLIGALLLGRRHKKASTSSRSSRKWYVR